MSITRLQRRIETAETKVAARTGDIRRRFAICAKADAPAELARLRRDEGWTANDTLVVLVPATGTRRTTH